MTCVSVNRLTLSLRAFYETREFETIVMSHNTVEITVGGRHMKRRRSWIGTSTFESIGDSRVQNGSGENRGASEFELHFLQAPSFDRRQEFSETPLREEYVTSYSRCLSRPTVLTPNSKS